MSNETNSTTGLDQLARDYARVEQAIEYLEDNYLEQPELDEVAAAVNLSPGHFQRTFSRWAGVSPKRFAQYLTLDHARQLLADSEPVLDAALGSGLSGPSRRHDLFVTYEAMTPGAYRRGGAGVEITWGVQPTPFGLCYAGQTEHGLCALGFLGDKAPELDAAIRVRWPRAILQRSDDALAPVIEQAFGDSGGRLPVHVVGTNFQLKVWEALLRVPPGAVISYDRLANFMGRPGAARAVAGAVARNPVGWLIPCHRVIQKSGRFSGYAWGPMRKRAMIAREAAGAMENA